MPTYFEIKNNHPYFRLTSSYFDQNKKNGKLKDSSKSSAKILLHKNHVMSFIQYLSVNNDGTIPCLFFALELLAFYTGQNEALEREKKIDDKHLKALKIKPSRQSTAPVNFDYSEDTEICVLNIVIAIKRIQKREKEQLTPEEKKQRVLVMEEIEDLQSDVDNLEKKINGSSESGDDNSVKNLTDILDNEINTLIVQVSTQPQPSENKVKQNNNQEKEKNKKRTSFFGLFSSSAKESRAPTTTTTSSLTQQRQEQSAQINNLQQKAQQLRQQAEKVQEIVEKKEDNAPEAVAQTTYITQPVKKGKMEEEIIGANEASIPQDVLTQIKIKMPQWRSDDKNKRWFINSYLEIVKVPVFPDKKSKNQNVTYNYYLVNKREKLGEGAFGVVYKSYPIDGKNNVNLKKPFVLKVYKNAEDLDQVIEDAAKEERYARGHYLTETPLIVNNEVYYFMEFIPGEELNPKNPKFKNLSVFQRVEILSLLIDQLNLTHNNTPTTGKAAAHADLKFENFRVFIPKDKSLPIRARIVDYGLADNISDDANVQTAQDGRGTPLYMSPDAWKGKISAKTDMFSFFIMFIFFMGGNPLLYRQLLLNQRKDPNLCENMVNTQINVDGLFSNITFPDYLKPFEDAIKRAIKMLCTRGVNLLNYQERPSSNEAQDFLRIFRQLIVREKNNDQRNQIVCVAQLNLIAANLWSTEIDGKTKCSDYSFDRNLVLCEAINLLQNLNMLTNANLKLLFVEDVAEAMIKLHTGKHFDVNILNKFITDSRICKNVVKSPSVTLAYLFISDSAEQKRYFQSQPRRMQLIIFKELLKNSNKYLDVWGQKAFENLQKKIGKILTTRNMNYYVYKKSLEREQREGTWRCFNIGGNNGDKADATDLLIKTVKGGLPLFTFFAEENKAKRNALMEFFSESRENSADLVECLQSVYTP